MIAPSVQISLARTLMQLPKACGPVSSTQRAVEVSVVLSPTAIAVAVLAERPRHCVGRVWLFASHDQDSLCASVVGWTTDKILSLESHDLVVGVAGKWKKFGAST